RHSRPGVVGALSAARHGRLLFCGRGGARRRFRRRRHSHVARERRNRRCPPFVSLFPDLSRAHVRRHGDRQNRRFVKRLLVTLGLGVFAGALDLSVLAPALPAIGKDFGVQTSDLAWVFTIYLLATIVSIAIASAFADRYGRRNVYIGCIALFAAGSVLAMAAPSYPVFIAARALQALGAGGIFPVATAAIGDVVPHERRGAALGMV